MRRGMIEKARRNAHAFTDSTWPIRISRRSSSSSWAGRSSCWRAAKAKGRTPGNDRRHRGSHALLSWRSALVACRAIDLAWCRAFHLRRASGLAPGCAGSVLDRAEPTPGGRRRTGRHLAGITEIKPTTQVTVIARKPNLPAP